MLGFCKRHTLVEAPNRPNTTETQAGCSEESEHCTAFARCGIAVTNKSRANAAKIAFIAASQFFEKQS
jgi:hypothetical protein